MVLLTLYYASNYYFVATSSMWRLQQISGYKLLAEYVYTERALIISRSSIGCHSTF